MTPAICTAQHNVSGSARRFGFGSNIAISSRAKIKRRQNVHALHFPMQEERLMRPAQFNPEIP
jgi:hypothetical protein